MARYEGYLFQRCTEVFAFLCLDDVTRLRGRLV